MNKNSIKFIMESKLVNNLVLVDGLGRSGKFFLGKIVSGFKNVEYFQYASLLEQLPYMIKLGSITEDAGITLLRTHIDEYYYYMQLGRNINFRIDDATSIRNSLEMEDYLNRSKAKYGEELKQKVLNNTHRKVLFVLHHTLPNISIYFKSHPALRLIHLTRHPIDLIYSWYKENVYERTSTKTFNFWPNIKGEKDSIPWYAHEWRDEYENTNGIDRIIKSIAFLTGLEKKASISFSEKQKQQVLDLKYENVVENTSDIVKQISSFLKTDPLKEIDSLLKKEKCPKTLSIQERKKKEEIVLDMASPQCVSLVEEMVHDYTS